MQQLSTQGCQRSVEDATDKTEDDSDVRCDPTKDDQVKTLSPELTPVSYESTNRKHFYLTHFCLYKCLKTIPQLLVFETFTHTLLQP